MKRIALLASCFVLAVTSSGVEARPAAETTAKTIDFAAFMKISEEVIKVRPQRLLALDDFLVRAANPDVVVLDSRSDWAYKAKHLSGALHLSLSDMTEESLRQVLGSKERTVLIYCNNNFKDDEPPVPSKIGPAALNIPTFITLWAYGYENVYELGELLELSDPRLSLEGFMVDAGSESFQAAQVESRAQRP